MKKKWNAVPVFACLFINPLLAQQSALNTTMWHPESVISDGEFLYVTDIGKQLDALAKDGDGVIHKLSLDGVLLEQNISKEKLHAPKGTAIVKDVLYVADLDRIVGLQVSSGEKTVCIDFSSLGVQLLNDLAVKNDTTLFASSTDQHKVFEVSLSANHRIKELQIPDIKGANGICYDNKRNRLYVAGLGSFTSIKGEGEIGYMEFAGNKTHYVKLPNITGFFDGIALTDDHTLIVSDWVNLSKAAGVIKKINLKTQKVTIMNTDLIAGPADFSFDKEKMQLLIPVTQEGKLLKFLLK